MAAFVFLLVDFSVAENLRCHVRGQCVYTRYTDAVQTTGNFVGTLVEFTAGMQHGHDNFESGFLFFFVKVYRNTASVVLYGDRVIFVDGNFDVVAITGERFVDGVVYNLVNQVMESLGTNVADVHGRTLTYSL